MALKVRSHQELSVWSVKEDNRSSRNWQDSAIKLNYNLTNCYVNLHLIKGLKKRNISSSPVELTAPSKYSNPGAQSYSPYGTRASAWPAFKKNSVAFFSLVLRGIFFTLIILRIDLRKNKQYIFFKRSLSYALFVKKQAAFFCLIMYKYWYLWAHHHKKAACLMPIKIEMETSANPNHNDILRYM